jgi:Flp pilus assembly protein TadB
LIPLGCALTCAALVGATRSVRAGDHNRTNRMFRARIYAQGFTIVAMVAGSMYWQTDRQKRKEFEGVIAEQKAREKNQAWIRELEARDEEEKELKASKEKRKRLALERAEEKGKPAGGSVASSIVDEKERRRKGVMEAVQELILYGKK